MRSNLLAAALAASVLLAVGAPAQTTHRRGTGQAASRTSASPELVGLLSKELHVTRRQAEGGAGAVSYAKKKLAPEDYAKVAAVVPGIDDLTNRAPSQSGGGSILSSLENVSGSEMGGAPGAAVTLSPAFQKLGMSGETVLRFVPVIVQYVTKRGGSETGDVLAGALR